jgi:hypothetical protein
MKFVKILVITSTLNIRKWLKYVISKPSFSFIYMCVCATKIKKNNLCTTVSVFIGTFTTKIFENYRITFAVFVSPSVCLHVTN